MSESGWLLLDIIDFHLTFRHFRTRHTRILAAHCQVKSQNQFAKWSTTLMSLSITSKAVRAQFKKSFCFPALDSSFRFGALVFFVRVLAVFIFLHRLITDANLYLGKSSSRNRAPEFSSTFVPNDCQLLTKRVPVFYLIHNVTLVPHLVTEIP
jgi:hypothetical protein